MAFSGIFTFLVDAYPQFAASALAANSFARSSFAGVFPLFGIQSKSLCHLPYDPFGGSISVANWADIYISIVYDRLGIQWATSLLGFLTLIMIPFP
jgi:hypothetical protein